MPNWDPQEAQIERRLLADAQFAALWADVLATSRKPRSPEHHEALKAAEEYAKATGMLPKDFRFKIGESNSGSPSRLEVDHQNFAERHPVATGAMISGAALAPFVLPAVLGGGSGAAAGSGAATTPSIGAVGTTVPAGIGTSVAAPVAPGATALPSIGTVSTTVPTGIGTSVAAPVAPPVAGAGTAVAETAGAGVGDAFAPASTKGWFNNPWVKLAIGVGVPAVGSYLDYRAQSNAIEAGERATDKALELQREAAAEAKRLAERQYADKAPYREAGAAAQSTLAALMGLSPVRPAQPAAPQTPAPGGAGSGGRQPSEDAVFTGRYAVPRGTTAAQRAAGATIGAVGAPAPARVRAPNGNIYAVPAEKVNEAVANGGQVV